MSASNPKRPVQLSTDGELDDLDTLLGESEPSAEPIYCTRCGTSNLSDANYCRKCGKSLELEAAPVLQVGYQGKNKLKNDEQAQPESNSKRDTSDGVMVSRVLTMVLVAGMAITAFAMQEGVIALFVLLAWFLVEAVRGDKKHRPMSSAAVAADVLTTLFVAGMVITATAMHQGVAALVVLLAWFLVEAVRSD